MNKSKNRTSSQKDSTEAIGLLHSVKAQIPAIGNPAASDTDTLSKQTAVSAVPAFSDICGMLEKLANCINNKSALAIFTYNPLLSLYFTRSMKVGAVQTRPLPTSLYYENWIYQIRKNRMERLKDAVMNTNPKYGSTPGYSTNCQRCGFILIKRMHGEKYVAYPSGEIDNFQNLDTLFTVIKTPPDLHKSIIKAESKESLIKIIEDKMKQWGEESIAVIGVNVKGWPIGHIFNTVQINDTTRYVDAQMHLMDCKTLLDSLDYPQNIVFFRADTLTFDEEKFKEFIGSLDAN